MKKKDDEMLIIEHEIDVESTGNADPGTDVENTGNADSKTDIENTGNADADTRQRDKDKRAIKNFLIRLIALLLMIWILFGLVFGLTPMANQDMMPRLSAGDLLLFYRMENRWNTGDVAVIEKDGSKYVSRIIARPGDTVEITPESTLMINGSLIIETDIYYTTPRYDVDISYPITLGADEYFVLCDLREGGRDSRYFGPVTVKELKGKVITAIRRTGI